MYFEQHVGEWVPMQSGNETNDLLKSGPAATSPLLTRFHEWSQRNVIGCRIESIQVRHHVLLSFWVKMVLANFKEGCGEEGSKSRALAKYRLPPPQILRGYTHIPY